MVESAIGLEEVVVIGYGTQKKVNLTGAVSSISFDNKAITNRALTNVSSALAGMSSGTFIIQKNGQPSSDAATILIRGTGSLNASQSPLVIVDGQVGDINSVSPNDVQSVSILKDASSAAIYGSRASNGVILITTKTGSNTENKVTFSYDAYVGSSRPTKVHKLISNTADHLEMSNLAATNSGFDPPATQAQLDEWRLKSKTDPIGYPNTDWWSVLMKPNTVQSHSISATGGNKKVKFYTAFNTFSNDGLIANTGYKRNTFRNNLTYKVTDWLELGNILSLLSGKAQPADGESIFYWWRATTPGLLPKNPDGRYGAAQTSAGEDQSNNPVWSAETSLGTKDTRKYNAKIFGILTPLNGLKITGSYYLDRTDYDGWSSARPEDRWNFQTNTVVFSTASDPLWVANFYNKTESRILDLFADYDKSFGEHTIHILAGYNQEYNKYSTLAASKSGLLSLDIPVLDAGTTAPTVGGTSTDYAIRSYFGRINYNYLNKYLFEANVRYDGSSRFAPNKRWGLFPSFSLGWRITEENFWSGSKTIINDLKIRGSWGQLG